MYPKLLHLYGPFFVNSYGTMIALALAIFTWLINKDERRAKLISSEDFYWIVILGIISGILGGRILYFLLDGNLSIVDFFAFWQGGFAVLGSLIGVLSVAPWYLKKHGIPLLPFLDLIALYAPLLQGISRIGCFLAGCCYGKPTQAWWAITYENQACTAPLHIALHPSQLYSAALLLGIFCLLYFFLQKRIKNNGQLLCCYIFFMATERSITDFFRGDQSYSVSIFGSPYQIVALGLMILATIFFIKISCTKQLTTDKAL